MKIFMIVFLCLCIAVPVYADASSVEITDEMGDIPYELRKDGEIIAYYQGTEEITQQEYEAYEEPKTVAEEIAAMKADIEKNKADIAAKEITP